MMSKRRKRNRNKRWKSTRQQYDRTVSAKKTQSQKQLDFDNYLGVEKSFKPAFTVGNLTFWGGPQSDLSTKCWDVVISCLEFNKFIITEVFVAKASKVVKCISIPWDNNEATFLTNKQWQNIIDELPNEGDVAVCCFGGRGRTGTALAILKALLTKSQADPVLEIRKAYLQNAVESDVQVNYVERITNLKSECNGSDNHYAPYYGYLDDWYYGYNYSEWNGRNDDAVATDNNYGTEQKVPSLLGFAQARTY